MTAHRDPKVLGAVACHALEGLLTDILRKRLGLWGIVIGGTRDAGDCQKMQVARLR